MHPTAARFQQRLHELGLDVYSDGEYRRTWFAGAWSALEGLVDGPPQSFLRRGWRGESSELAAEELGRVANRGAVGAPARLTRRLAGEECAFMREHAPGPFKITLPSAATGGLYWFQRGVTDAVYPTRRDLVDALLAGERDPDVLAELADRAAVGVGGG